MFTLGGGGGGLGFFGLGRGVGSKLENHLNLIYTLIHFFVVFKFERWTDKNP